MQGTLLDLATVLLILAALFSYLNHKFLKLPLTIGLMISGLVAAGLILILDLAFPALALKQTVRQAMDLVDFPASLMQGMLGFLLFAGALHINIEDLLRRRYVIAVLATVGVLISTAIVGGASYALFKAVGTDISLAYCLVFGALISPTDPIAVLGVMKSLGAPRSLEIKVAGESLFNDGVGVVVFSVLLAAAAGGAGHGTPAGTGFHAAQLAAVLGREVLGGLFLGMVAGYLVYLLMKSLDAPNLEVLLSFALVLGITRTATHLHTSAPLACVIAGIFIGNQGRKLAMSDRTSHALDLVWSFVDQTLNAVLFLLVGVETITHLSWRPAELLAATALIGITLAGRFLSVCLPLAVLRCFLTFSPGVIRILTWGGLKGGISIALALSLPAFPGRSAIITATSLIIVFSVVVQGLTIGPLIRRQMARRAAAT